jgi:hypothetical protein
VTAQAIDTSSHLVAQGRAARASVRPVTVIQTVRSTREPDRPGRSVVAEAIDAEVRDLLARIAQQEELAEDAQADMAKFFGWPSWSMDTGLTPAQERFVEHWSPQRVLDDTAMLRRLVGLLQRWSDATDDDESLAEALTLVRKLHAL